MCSRLILAADSYIKNRADNNSFLLQKYGKNVADKSTVIVISKTGRYTYFMKNIGINKRKVKGMIQERILDLVEYARVTGLIEAEDERFSINRLLELFQLDELEDEAVAAHGKNKRMTRETAEAALEDILTEMLDYAYENGITKENSIVYRDLFDTKIMSLLVPRPSEVISKFNELYKKDKKAATDYFYTLSCDSNYIRRYRIKKDLKWTTDTEYGTLDITINLSKPEKDPKAIAAAKLAKQSGYPKCLL